MINSTLALHAVGFPPEHPALGTRAGLLRTLDQKSTSADDVNSDTENFDED